MNSKNIFRSQILTSYFVHVPYCNVGAAIVWFVAILLCGATHGYPAKPAQENSANANDIRTVYVAVTGKNSAPMPDLKPEDFSVQENGAPQQILKVLPIGDKPLAIGVFVDISGSEGERSNKTRHKDLDTISVFLADALHNQHGNQALLMAFAEKPFRVTGLTSSFPDIQAGLKKIDTTRPRGSTTLYECLTRSLELLPRDQTQRKIIIVLSDFDDNSTQENFADMIGSVQGVGASIFALVELNPDNKKASRKSWEMAQRAARETGGAAYRIDSRDDLQAALAQIQKLLRSSYELKYRSTAQPKKDGKVQLKVTVQLKHVTVTAADHGFPAF